MTLFSGLPALVIEDAEGSGEVVWVRARTRHGAVRCPGVAPKRPAGTSIAGGWRRTFPSAVAASWSGCGSQASWIVTSGASRLTAQVSTVARQ